jgi:hypothetical protein
MVANLLGRESRLETDAIAICKAIFLVGRKEGGFACARSSLPNLSGVGKGAFTRALEWGADARWLRLDGEKVRLTAAGIFIAKRGLDLPR